MAVKVDTSGAERKLRAAKEAIQHNKKIIEQAARMYIRQARQRVEEQGRGTSGDVMPPYSPDYKRRREESGRDSDRRTLTWTGQMHQGRQILKLTEESALIGWKVGPEARKAQGNQSRTPWVGPTPEERKAVLKYLRENIKRKVKEKTR